MKSYENFVNALQNLHDIENYQEPYDNVVLTGLVALYEICFEQAWKAMKEKLLQHGFPEGQTGSPKKILKTAYQAGMIRDEALWIEALAARNDVVHSYNKNIADSIVANVRTAFLPMFDELRVELSENWD